MDGLIRRTGRLNVPKSKMKIVHRIFRPVSSYSTVQAVKTQYECSLYGADQTGQNIKILNKNHITQEKISIMPSGRFLYEPLGFGMRTTICQTFKSHF